MDSGVFAEYAECNAKQDTKGLLSVLCSLEENPYRLSKDQKPNFLKKILQDFDSLSSTWWTEEVSLVAMKVIKRLGKDVDGSDIVYSEEGMRILMKAGGLLDKHNVIDTPTSRQALRCIANCILIKESTKQFLEQQDAVLACIHLLSASHLSLEAQFLKCRILYFMTLRRPDLAKRLILLNIIPGLENIVTSNVDILIKSPNTENSGLNRAVLDEAFKLQSNIMKLHWHNLLQDADKDVQQATLEVANLFSASLNPLLDLLLYIPLPTPFSLSAPYETALEMLLLFPYQTAFSIWAARSEFSNDIAALYDMLTDRLCTMLRLSLQYYFPENEPIDNMNTYKHCIDALLPPLITALRVAAFCSQHFKSRIAQRLLPETKQTAGQDTLCSQKQDIVLIDYLQKLMVSKMQPKTREAVHILLLTLCQDNDSRLKSLFDTDESSQAQQDSCNAQDRKGHLNLAAMTNEEKEKESERLFLHFCTKEETSESPKMADMRDLRVYKTK